MGVYKTYRRLVLLLDSYKVRIVLKKRVTVESPILPSNNTGQHGFVSRVPKVVINAVFLFSKTYSEFLHYPALNPKLNSTTS